VALSVLHINTADNLGGAARSAYKIHSGVRALGARSKMLVRTRVTSDPDVDVLNGGRWRWRLLDGFGARIVDAAGLQYLYYPSSFALLRHPWLQEAQVVQLYNTHGGYFTHRVLPELSRRRPVVWRLSDMWPLTGHCAYSLDCERWTSGCGACPLLHDYPALPWDTTKRLFRIKADLYARSRLVVVATNSWMEEQVRRSPLLGRFPIHRIPNGVDVSTFRPMDKGDARRVLGLEDDRPIVLFAAHVARPGTRKGGEYVAPALARAAAAGVRFRLVVLGEGAAAWPESGAYPTSRLEFTTDNARLAQVYAAADLLLWPAVAENFPNGIVEAMACGTPAVAFDTGGVRDAVRDGKTGYRAAHRDVDDLARGIGLLLGDAALLREMSEACRRVAADEYDEKTQARRHHDLYASLAEERG
jgi:glycosyltransferase involved in cell wall biosynthesis